VSIESRGLWIRGQEQPGSAGTTIEVRSPYDDVLVGSVTVASESDVADAVSAAVDAQQHHMRPMPVHQRAAILRATAQILRRDAEQMANLLVREVGKPIRDARREASRAADLFELAANLAGTLEGHVLAMDVLRGGENRWGFSIRVPVGVVAALAPFNSPLNLTVNKVAPALAAGNAVVLKPASKTPLSAYLLAAALQEAGLPDGAFNIVVGGGQAVGEPLVRDPRVRMVTFTGSVGAGEAITRAAGVKKLALELGSSAANIVCADADVAAAARTLATSAYLSSGQACIAAQRLIVHRGVWDEFVEAFVAAAEAMNIGDPLDDATEIGPMISIEDVDRISEWIAEAVAGGARILTGGERVERTIRPALLADVPPTSRLACEEAFGPVATIAPFETLEEAIVTANDSPFGLQGAIFTRDMGNVLLAAADFHVGGLWVNESSRYRQDNYPFGGLKLSGIGREGVRYALEEMTELKFVGVKTGPSSGIL